VPHNLISTQESPVPLLKFHMAPRLKILIASGSKNEPRYTLLVSQKSQQTNPLQVPQQGPYGEGGPPTGHFAYLSKTSSYGFPSKGALPQSPPNGILPREMPHHYSPPSFIYRSPRYTSPPPAYQVPLDWKGVPAEMPVSGDFLNMSSRVPSVGATLHGASSERERERRFIRRDPFIHLSKSPVGEPTSRFPKRGPIMCKYVSA